VDVAPVRFAVNRPEPVIAETVRIRVNYSLFTSGADVGNKLEALRAAFFLFSAVQPTFQFN
jgi:hypothetical protein